MMYTTMDKARKDHLLYDDMGRPISGAFGYGVHPFHCNILISSSV